MIDKLELMMRCATGMPPQHPDQIGVIRGLLTTSTAGFGDALLTDVALEPLFGGRSGTSVLKASHIASGEHADRRCAVLKIGPNAEIEAERVVYETLVRPFLPTLVRPELLGHMRVGEHAGLIYSFIGDQAELPETASDRLQVSDTRWLDPFMMDFVEPMKHGWYHRHLMRQEQDIAGRYREHYFAGRPDPLATEARFKTYAKRYLKVDVHDGCYRINGQRFPPLHHVLFGPSKRRAYHSCIQHGDLNSDNIVILREPLRISVVDFRKTGRGHVFEDLVAVESSIRINHADAMTTSMIWETEWRIAQGCPLESSYGLAIRRVRDAARSCFDSIEDWSNYHWAVAAIGLRLMQAVDLTHAARARIVASAIWASMLLQG